jgi:hypothetical protein
VLNYALQMCLFVAAVVLTVVAILRIGYKLYALKHSAVSTLSISLSPLHLDPHVAYTCIGLHTTGETPNDALHAVISVC